MQYQYLSVREISCSCLRFVILSIFAGELYVQAQRMFDDHLYTQLLGIIGLAVKQAIINNDNFETEFVSEPLHSPFCIARLPVFLQLYGSEC